MTEQRESRLEVYGGAEITPITMVRGGIVRLDDERKEALKRTYFKGLEEAEIEVALAVVERTGLSPEGKQIYFIKRWDSKLKREVMQIQVAIDGFRLIAERTGNYVGQLGPFWCGEDAQWKDVWLGKEPPLAARVGVLHRHFREPLWSVARFDSYVQTGVNQQTKERYVTGLWKTMPDLMLAKCAESLALRRAFPQELSGLHTSDEMAQAFEVGGAVDGQPTPSRVLAPPADEHERLMRAVHAAGKGLGWTHDVLHAWAVSKGHESLNDASDAELDALVQSFRKQPQRARDAVARYQPQATVGTTPSAADAAGDVVDGQFTEVDGRQVDTATGEVSDDAFPDDAYETDPALLNILTPDDLRPNNPDRWTN